jgi:hypothetical protein
VDEVVTKIIQHTATNKSIQNMIRTYFNRFRLVILSGNKLFQTNLRQEGYNVSLRHNSPSSKKTFSLTILYFLSHSFPAVLALSRIENPFGNMAALSRRRAVVEHKSCTTLYTTWRFLATQRKEYPGQLMVVYRARAVSHPDRFSY